MGFKTLDDFKKNVDSKRSNRSGGRILVVKDGEAYRIRFLQELVESGDNFNPERGLARVVSVHQSPVNFRRKAECTLGVDAYGGRCWACDQVRKDKKWNDKTHLLVNVAVKTGQGDGDWEAKVLDQHFTQFHIGDEIVEYASEFGSLLHHDFKISRKGSKLDTNYSIMAVQPREEPAVVSDLELHDLTTIFKSLDYDAQEEFFLTDADDDGNSNASRDDERSVEAF